MTTSKGDTKNIVDFSSVSYVKILVPHDTTEMSDKALAHAIYISKMTGAQIELFYVHEHYKDIPPIQFLHLLGLIDHWRKLKRNLKMLQKQE